MHAALPLLAAAALALPPQELQAPGAEAEKPWKLNAHVTEEITLTALDGKKHTLFAENDERAVVLVFWSWKDPVSRFYAPHLKDLADRKAGKASIYLVDSNHDELVGGNDPLERMKKVVAKEKVRLPILLDPGNVLADDFAALANGQAFVIDANRFLRYHGGIDDDPTGKRRAAGVEVQPWLETALDDVLAGKPPEPNWRRPAGRPIKRAPVGEEKDGR